MNDVSGNNEGAQSEWSPDELIPFGKYILLDRINSGATAAVYRANVRGEAGFERLVAIKRILPHMAGDRDFVDTFVREAKTVARLTHAGICPIYELGKVGESLYMAIEYIQGKDLGHIMRKLAKRGETMSPVVAAFIAARLCDSLDYAHNLKNASGKRTGILHRDLSPANTIVSYEGQVRLIDFGLAKAVGRAQSTNVDALKRKLGYMSPEMVKGKPLDGRSDIFGVGVCLYEMITGRRLFSGANDIDTLKLVGKATVPPPSAIIDDAPEELEIIVMHALEREREDRFQTAAEMGETLTAYLHKADPTFNSSRLQAWMEALFGPDIEREQQRIKRLLQASADPELIKQRKLFFATATGAAARARAEIERRFSTEPPPVSATFGTSMPKNARLPREMAALPSRNGGAPTHRSDAPAATTSAPAATTSPPAAAISAPALFEDEPTNFYDPEKTSGYEPSAHPSGNPFDDEPTNFMGPEDRPRGVPLVPARSGGGFDFEEEPTEIFFNKEDGVGIPEILEEINDVDRAPAPLNRPIVAPELGAAQVTASARPSRLPPTAGPPVRATPVPARPLTPAPAPWETAGPAPQWPSAPPRPARRPLLMPIAGAAVVALIAVAALLAFTPLGWQLGVRTPPRGAVEVRTNPAVPAEVDLDRVYRGRAPLRLEQVEAGPRQLDIRAEGYLPVTREVVVNPGATALVDIALVPDRPKPAEATPAVPSEAATPGAPAPSSAAPTGAAAPNPVPGATPTGAAPAPGSEPRPSSSASSSRKRTKKHGDPTAPAGVAMTNQGLLVVNSVPWAVVFIDGRDTGRSTPLMSYPIAAGSHEIKLQTSAGQVHVERVTVPPGQTVRITRRF